MSQSKAAQSPGPLSYYTQRQLADVLGVSPKTIGRWAKDPNGPLPPPVKIGKRLIRWDAAAVNAALAKLSA